MRLLEDFRALNFEFTNYHSLQQQAVREPPRYALAPVTLTFNLWPLNLKVVSESRVTWAVC